MLLSWYRSVILVFLAALVSLVVVKGIEVGIDADGTTQIINGAKSVVFRNFYTDRAVHLFWEGEDGTTVKMGKVGEKGGAADINTFVGHTFFATLDAEAKQRAIPSEVRTH
jgi:hypothetical protein